MQTCVRANYGVLQPSSQSSTSRHYLGLSWGGVPGGVEVREARCQLGRCWTRQEGQRKAAVLPEGWGESLAQSGEEIPERRAEEDWESCGGKGESVWWPRESG